jgi:hypothetical protein
MYLQSSSNSDDIFAKNSDLFLNQVLKINQNQGPKHENRNDDNNYLIQTEAMIPPPPTNHETDQSNQRHTQPPTHTRAHASGLNSSILAILPLLIAEHTQFGTFIHSCKVTLSFHTTMRSHQSIKLQSNEYKVVHTWSSQIKTPKQTPQFTSFTIDHTSNQPTNRRINQLINHSLQVSS